MDLERRRVVDLLPEGTGKSLQEWLSNRPTITTINRDRAGVYADGASKGAPQAVQIATAFICS